MSIQFWFLNFHTKYVWLYGTKSKDTDNVCMCVCMRARATVLYVFATVAKSYRLRVSSSIKNKTEKYIIIITNEIKHISLLQITYVENYVSRLWYVIVNRGLTVWDGGTRLCGTHRSLQGFRPPKIFITLPPPISSVIFTIFSLF